MFASRPDSIEFVLEYRLESETEFRPAGITGSRCLRPMPPANGPWAALRELPVCTSGERFVYRVVEKPVTGYAPAYSPAFGDDMTVTNTLSTLTSLVVGKTWDDNGMPSSRGPLRSHSACNISSSRPDSSRSRTKWLDSGLYTEMKPGAAGNWPAVSFTDLPAVNASGEATPTARSRSIQRRMSRTP